MRKFTLYLSSLSLRVLQINKCVVFLAFQDSQKRKDTAGYKLANGKRSMQVNIETNCNNEQRKSGYDTNTRDPKKAASESLSEKP